MFVAEQSDATMSLPLAFINDGDGDVPFGLVCRQASISAADAYAPSSLVR